MQVSGASEEEMETTSIQTLTATLIVSTMQVSGASEENAQMSRARAVVLKVCPSCGKKMISARLGKHVGACQRRQTRLLDRRVAAEAAARASGAASGLDEAERLGHMPPQPPQRLRVSKTSSCSVHLMWEAPVFTGGAPIVDYEVEYSL